MSFPVEIAGDELVRALVNGGFRVCRRDGRATLLVRRGRLVGVRENEIVRGSELTSLLARADASRADLLRWLAVRYTGPAGGEVVRSLSDVIATARRLAARTAEMDAHARAVLEDSRQSLVRLTSNPARCAPNSERLRVARTAVEKWHDALRDATTDPRPVTRDRPR